jgi:hypothetical protein
LNRIVLIAIASLLCLTPSIGAAEKKIYVQETMIVAPDTYAELVEESPLIVRVRVSAAHVRGVAAKPDAIPNVFTEYKATVTNVFRGTLKEGVEISFVQRAGEYEEETRITRVEDAIPLETDREYIVFLRYVPAMKVYTLVAEREAAFQIRHGVIVPQGTSEIAEDRRDMKADTFVSELQRTIIRRPAKAAQ